MNDRLNHLDNEGEKYSITSYNWLLKDKEISNRELEKTVENNNMVLKERASIVYDLFLKELLKEGFFTKKPLQELNVELYKIFIECDIKFNYNSNNDTDLNTYLDYQNAIKQTLDKKLLDFFETVDSTMCNTHETNIFDIFNSVVDTNTLIDFLNRLGIQDNSEKKA